MNDCREYIEECLLNGEKIQYVYEEHCRETILKQLKEMSELSRIADMQLIKEEEEEGEERAMLWVLEENELIEKGMYRYNKPDTELLVCAPPALMAVILGEYELAQRICMLTPRNYENDIAFEVLQDEQGPYLKGGRYRFCEVCMLSADMKAEETTYFSEIGMFKIDLYYEHENSFFSKVCIHGDEKQRWKCLFKTMERVRLQEDVCESFQGFMMLLLWYAFMHKMDKNNQDFWKDIYSVCGRDEQRNSVVELMHGYMLQRSEVISDIRGKEHRILACIEEHFRHTDSLSVDGCVGKYIGCIIDMYNEAEMKHYLYSYFMAVKRFGGNDVAEWRKRLLKLLEMKDFALIEMAFQCHFFRKDWLEEYIEYFINQKNHTLILPYLIQKKWILKENAHGNV